MSRLVFVLLLLWSCSVDPSNCAWWHWLSTMTAGGADITPDQFDWYFYQGRAFGIHVELNCGTFCSGKMLLGSYMKKPLWVDHSAVTVGALNKMSVAAPWPLFTSPFSSLARIPQIFHLLTSSVNVVIDGSVSLFNPAQAFAVPCGKNSKLWLVTRSLILSNCQYNWLLWSLLFVLTGHAYSIQNVSAQPAVLYFTRMFSESSDWRQQPGLHGEKKKQPLLNCVV